MPLVQRFGVCPVWKIFYNKAKVTYYDDGSTPSSKFTAYSGQSGCDDGDYTVVPVIADFTTYDVDADMVKVVYPSDLTIADLKTIFTNSLK
jgi:hypothetical protein